MHGVAVARLLERQLCFLDSSGGEGPAGASIIPCPWHLGIVTDSLPPTWSILAHRHAHTDTPQKKKQPTYTHPGER